MMTHDGAIRDIAESVGRLLAAGFIVTGEISFCRPATPGLVETEVVAAIGEASSVRMLEKKKEAKVIHIYKPVANTGECCSNCGGSNLRWAGACKTCSDCGTAGGCG